MHISDSEYLANGYRYGKHCPCQHIGSRIQPFDWHIYIYSWPVLMVKVKVMHILTVNISGMVTDMINITIALIFVCNVIFGLVDIDSSICVFYIV